MLGCLTGRSRCLNELARPGRWSPKPNWGLPGTRATEGTCTPGFSSPAWSPCATVPHPLCLEWTGVPGRALPMQTKENTSDVEAALGTSHRLTGTAFGREPATLNGRRRGTKEFLGRGERSSQSKGTRSKFRSADPVDVFGAASRGHRKRRQSFDADNYVARSILPGLNNNEDFNLQNSGVRALDFPGHRCVRTNGERAEDGGRPVHRTPLSHAGDALSSGRMGAQHSAQT